MSSQASGGSASTGVTFREALSLLKIVQRNVKTRRNNRYLIKKQNKKSVMAAMKEAAPRLDLELEENDSKGKILCVYAQKCHGN